jgi:hypothetical protein
MERHNRSCYHSIYQVCNFIQEINKHLFEVEAHEPSSTLTHEYIHKQSWLVSAEAGRVADLVRPFSCTRITSSRPPQSPSPICSRTPRVASLPTAAPAAADVSSSPAPPLPLRRRPPFVLLPSQPAGRRRKAPSTRHVSPDLVRCSRTRSAPSSSLYSPAAPAPSSPTE